MIVTGYGVPIELLLRVWHEKQRARVFEIPHPAIYGGEISNKLVRKYTEEEISQKAQRLGDAYAAFLRVTQDLNISRERVMQVNGFRHF